MTKKAGFVAIIGKPNSGKSTLLNSMLGQDVSIVTPKPQTTRNKILGIYTKEDVQIIFADTPGILKPVYKLQDFMKHETESSFLRLHFLCNSSRISLPYRLRIAYFGRTPNSLQ